MSSVRPSSCVKTFLVLAGLFMAAAAVAPQAAAQTQLLVPSSSFAVYPKQIIGTTSAAQSIVVTNTSDSMTVQVSSVTFDADVPGFTETDNCVGGIAPGGSCTVTIAFAPTASNLCIQEPTLTLNDDDPGGPLQITLFGEGAAAGGLTTTDLTNQSLTATALAQSLVGKGVTISNVTFTGAPLAAGTFAGGQGIIGFDKGIILSNGAVSNVIGPNCDSGISQENGLPGDQDLTNLICTDATSCSSPTTTNDATVLEFDFVPTSTLLTFQYVFASDEYPEFVFDFNDVFAFFLNQNGSPKQDIALIPGTNTIVSINNVNNGNPGTPNIPPVNPQFYLDNNIQFPDTAPLNTEMDGLTTVLSVQAPVNAGQTYHIKLAIADALDDELDSNVFIKAGSLSSTTLAIVPPALGFGNLKAGGTSSPQTVMVTNQSGATLTGVTIAASAGFTETNNCPATLAVNASCTITVTFAPTVNGPLDGTITITDSAPDSPQTITAGGTGVTGAFVSISPFSLTFAPQAVGTTSPAQILTVTNTGGSALVFQGIVISTDFAESDTCQDETIAPGATCTISVTFTPTTTDAEAGSIELEDNAQTAGFQSVGLTGNATNTITIAPTTLGFGSQAINTTSAAQTVTFTNTGTTAVTIPSVVVGTGFTETNNCTATPIAAGASCAAMVTFTPTAVQAYATNLTFTDTAPNSPQMVALTGTGTNGTAPVTLTPNSLTFGPQTVGTTSAAQTVTVKNNGTGGLTFNSIAASGDYAVTNAGTCSVEGGLPSGGTCTVLVTFTPTTTGTRAGVLTITDSAANSPQTATLTGTGTGAAVTITLTPPSLTFGAQALGTTSASQNVVVMNTGTTTVTFTAITTSGDFSGATLAGCPTLAGGAQCTLPVAFTPTATGTRNGTITFTDNATGSPQMVTLTGTGTGGTSTVTITPTSLTFGSQALNTTSPAQTVMVKNNGTTTVNFNSFTTSGDFAVANAGTTCSTDGGIEGGASCTIAVTFTPTVAGTRGGTLAIADNATGSPQMVTLTGTGGGGTVVISVPTGGTTTGTTTPGGTTYFGIIITCAPGQTGTVTLTATSSSPLISVNLIPNTVVCPGGAQQAIQLQTFCQGTTVTTGSLPGSIGFGGGMLLFGSLLGGMAFMFRRTRRLGLTFALLAVAAVGAGSCGSLPKSPTGQATPPGTYFISLTATLNGQTTTSPNFLTLVVK